MVVVAVVFVVVVPDVVVVVGVVVVVIAKPLVEFQLGHTKLDRFFNENEQGKRKI